MFFSFASKKKKKPGQFPVYLNVYDLTQVNEYTYWIGIGIYHSGVQVHDTEYAFGGHETETTGIFQVEPRQFPGVPGVRFRKSIYIGETDLSRREVRDLISKLSAEYMGHTYNLITKNCNHFCRDVCLRLTGRKIPRWVNRLARLGLFCNCVLPAELHEKQVRPVLPEGSKVSNAEKAKLRKSKSASSSNRPALSPSPSSKSATPKSRQKRCVPSSSLVHASSNSTTLKV